MDLVKDPAGAPDEPGAPDKPDRQNAATTKELTQERSLFDVDLVIRRFYTLFEFLKPKFCWLELIHIIYRRIWLNHGLHIQPPETRVDNQSPQISVLEISRRPHRRAKDAAGHSRG